MAEVQELIWNWRLAGTPNAVYYDFVNVEPSAPAFSKRKRNQSFFLNKRKWYKRINFWWEWLEQYSTRNVKDVQRISDISCGGGECYNFFLLVNPSWDKMTVLFANCDNCDEEEPQFCQIEFTDDDGTTKNEFRTCDCATNKFVITDFAKWKPRDMDWAGKLIGTDWVQINYSPWSDTPALGRFSWNNTFAWDQTVTLGDYLYVWKSRNQDGDWYCGQVRQVLWYETPAGQDNYLRVSSPWLWFATDQTEWPNLTFSVFPERWKVIWFYTFDGLYLIHYAEQTASTCDSFVSLVCDYGTSFTWSKKCASNIVEHLWRVNILFDNGYNAFWESSYNKFFITTDTQAYLGADKITTASFRNYLLSFGESTISTTVFDWSSAFTTELSTNVGIRSSNAHTQFDNSFYFIWNDKRLHTLSIKSDWTAFLLELDDMSDFIRGELDLIQDSDEVFITADGRRMIIFICWSNGWSFNSKTKMLIFDRDYNLRHKHYVCCGAINWFAYDYYFWDWLYRYCWNQDCNWEYVESKIVAFVWEEEPNGMEFMMFKRKKLNRAKVLLWSGIYTNENTQLTVTMYRNGNKMSYVVDDIENISRIDQWNKLAQWTPIEPSECLTSDMWDCFVFDRPCEWSQFSEADMVASSQCWCPEEKASYDDYCNCVDDAQWYFLSEVYPLFVPLRDIRESDLYRVELRSWGWDQLSFGWFLLWVEQKDIDIHDPDKQDEWINSNCCSAQIAKPRSCS